MRRRRSRKILTLLAVLVLTVAAVEAALAFFDPLGARYINEISALFYRDTARPDPRGYTVTSGTHDGRYWSFSIGDDGMRVVPDTHPDAPRTAVFIGDSLTFGYGVNDDQAWVDLLARDFPEWHFVNAAMPAFNMENYARTLPLFPDADAIFVVTISNDRSDGPAIAPFRTVPPISPYISLYWLMLTRQLAPPQEDAAKVEVYKEDWEIQLRALAQDPRVHVVAFRDDYAPLVQAVVPDAAIVPYFSERTSAADPHANAAGNRQIYDSMLPVVRAALDAAE